MLIGYVSDERYVALPDVLLEFERDGETVGVARSTARGKVFAELEPGKYRAYRYEPPSHRLADVKLWWRDKRMRMGMPRKGSSPDEQQREGLNRER